MIRFATADYSFPLLSWEKSLRLAGDLGMTGIDLSLFQGRSHLKPEEVLANPSAAGARARAAVEATGLTVADVFGIPGKDFVDRCPNHPDAGIRRESREHFRRLVDFAVACESAHLTVLPGMAFDSEDFASSFARCVEELGWRLDVAHGAGLEFAVEGHTGSIISDPAQAGRLVQSVSGLTLTLDLGHWIAQGYKQVDANPLIDYTSHVHARCASPGRLQAPLKTNTIDFEDLVTRLTARHYTGWYAIEYVWIDWEHCNEVDNVSETILLREVLEGMAQQSHQS
jgi:sugar phosphate isomerase/epimerase